LIFNSKFHSVTALIPAHLLNMTTHDVARTLQNEILTRSLIEYDHTRRRTLQNEIRSFTHIIVCL